MPASTYLLIIGWSFNKAELRTTAILHHACSNLAYLRSYGYAAGGETSPVFLQKTRPLILVVCYNGQQNRQIQLCVTMSVDSANKFMTVCICSAPRLDVYEVSLTLFIYILEITYLIKSAAVSSGY